MPRNREKRRASKRLHYQNNRETVLAQQAKSLQRRLDAMTEQEQKAYHEKRRLLAKLRVRRYRERHPERASASKRTYQEKNRDRLNAERRTPEYRAKNAIWSRNYLANNGEKRRAQRRARDKINGPIYRAKNRERINAYRRAFRIKHGERLRAQERLRRQTAAFRLKRHAYLQVYSVMYNDIIKKRKSNYYKNNPEIAREEAKRRRARLKGATTIKFTATDWRRMQELCDHRCTYCGKRSKGRLTQDHVIPLSKGGQHCWDNITPACKSCNSKKFLAPPPVPVQLVMHI